MAHQFFRVSMLQADELPDDRAYLDGCSTVTAFKPKKYLENLRRVKQGVKINCNSGGMRTNIMGDYGSMTAWFIPEGIANIFSMSELKKRYRITYDSWQGYYMVHIASREVQFYKDEMVSHTSTWKGCSRTPRHCSFCRRPRRRKPCWCRPCARTTKDT